MPWAVLGTAVAAGGAYYGGERAADTAEGAAADARAAGRESQEFLEQGIQRARQGLQPYADQEAIARNAMMQQMGLLGPAQYGAPAGGGAYMGGAGTVPLGSPQIAADQGISEIAGGNVELNRFLEDFLGDQIAIAQNAGYSDTNMKAAEEGARRAEGLLQDMKREGLLPQDYQVPTFSQLSDMAVDMKSRGIDFGNYGLDPQGNPLPGVGDETWRAVVRRFEEAGGQEGIFGNRTADVLPDRQMLMGGGNDMRVPPGSIDSPTGSAPGSIPAIMGRAGATRAPEGFIERYYADAEAAPPEFGMGYRESPFYQAMMDENAALVNQAAASAGGLYSGRRGEALRDVSAQTQFDIYRDLADRERQAYESQMSRRGAIAGSELGREDAYYRDYMDYLSSLATPTTATNIANIEVGQAGNLAQIPGQTARMASSYDLEGAGAQNAALADIGGAIGGLLEDQPWQNRRTGSSGMDYSGWQNWPSI